MVQVAPFRGLRYGETVGDGDLAALTAPPYDAIDPATQRRLHAASPYNVVRLERPLGGGDDGASSRYAAAGDTYRRWRRDGILHRDPVPALYAYEQTTGGGHPHAQIGLLAALTLVPFDDGVVLPHEHVYPEPVADRLHLLRTLRANLSPVFGIYADRVDAVEQVLAGARARPPLAAFRDEEGITHRLWRHDDAGDAAAVTEALADVRVLLADGHHRYTSALRHQHATDGQEPGADAILTYLVGRDDGPRLRAMHRQVRRLPDDWQQRLSGHGAVLRRVPAPGDPAGVPAALASLEEPGEDGFAVLTRSGVWHVRPGRLAQLVPATTPRMLRGLTVTLLQTLLRDLLDVPDRIEDLYYTPDAEAAAADVAAGSHDAVFLVRPVPLEAVWRAAEDGVRMPPKSTSFHPKPRTGLVLRPLAD